MFWQPCVKWGELEYSGGPCNVCFTFVHKLVVIDTDSYQTKAHTGRVGIIQQAATAFIKPPANKDCYKFSFLPRLFAEWNKLPWNIPEAPTISIFKGKLQAMDMEHHRGAHFIQILLLSHLYVYILMNRDCAVYHRDQNQNFVIVVIS